MRQSARRRAKNLSRKEAYLRIAKKMRALVSAGNATDAKKLLPDMYQALDKAAKTNAMKKNKASRLKSRAAKYVEKTP